MKMIVVLVVSAILFSCSVDERKAPKKNFAPVTSGQFPDGQGSGKIYFQGSISLFHWPEGLSFDDEVTTKSEVMKISCDYDLYVESQLRKGPEIQISRKSIKSEFESLQCKTNDETSEHVARCSQLKADFAALPTHNDIGKALEQFAYRTISTIEKENWIEVSPFNFVSPTESGNVSYVEIHPANAPETPRCDVYLWGIGKGSTFAYTNVLTDSTDSSDAPSCLKEFKKQGSVTYCNYDSENDILQFEMREVEKLNAICVSKTDCSLIKVDKPMFCRKAQGILLYDRVSETGGVYKFELNRSQFIDEHNRFLGKFTYMSPDGIERKGAAKFDQKGAKDLFELYMSDSL